MQNIEAYTYYFDDHVVMGMLTPVVRTEDIPDSHIPLNTGVKDASFLTNMEKEIIVELNAIRTNPKQ